MSQPLQINPAHSLNEVQKVYPRCFCWTSSKELTDEAERSFLSVARWISGLNQTRVEGVQGWRRREELGWSSYHPVTPGPKAYRMAQSVKEAIEAETKTFTKPNWSSATRAEVWSKLYQVLLCCYKGHCSFSVIFQSLLMHHSYITHFLYSHGLFRFVQLQVLSWFSFLAFILLFFSPHPSIC